MAIRGGGGVGNGRGFDHPQFGMMELDWNTHRRTAQHTTRENLAWIISRTNATLTEATRILAHLTKKR